MRVDVFTIFPGLVDAFCAESLLGKARSTGLLDLRTHDLREHTTDVHRSVDDAPFGGGAGMVLRPQPVFANGVQRGYRVYPGRNRQQFAKLGLQPGDLVLSINGTPLDDPQRGMEIFNTIGTSDRVSVTVERNGQSQELTLNTAQIMLPDANSPPPGRTGQQRPIQTPAFTPEPE